MRMMSCIVLLISCFSLMAQQEHIPIHDAMEGSWEGVLTHPGGYRTEYIFYLEIKKVEDGYECWSMVRVDEIYAEMAMSGTSFDQELLILEDKEILTNDIEQGMEWCMKRYVLRLINDNGILRLEGDWNGTTSFGTCDPGKVHMKKRPPRV